MRTVAVKKEKLIQSPSEVRPHVVLLGAGASQAAFPNGDRSGHSLPLMNDLVDVVGLRPLIEQAGEKFDNEENFEKFYFKIASDPTFSNLKTVIENKIRDYFSSLRMPASTTIYDYLLLSLRRKDAIFTFNWGPFLFDAYIRNRNIAPLPEIFFLHGNVRIGMCPNHLGKWGERQRQCSICSEPFVGVPLLYPVEQKDYSNHSYIRGSWEAARYFFSEAFILTIFGYGAPASDIDAVELLKSAWLERSSRKLEHIEIIDIASSSDLYKRWQGFIPTGHLNPRCSFEESWIRMYPRRSVECLRYPVYCGVPAETSPLAESEKLLDIHEQILDIAEWETENDSSQE